MKKIFFFLCIFYASLVYCSSPHQFFFMLDTAYYPISTSNVVGEKSSFAPITDPFYGLDFRTTFKYQFVHPVPFGSGALTQKNTLIPAVSLEITPVSFSAYTDISFTPIAFVSFNAGAFTGTGWDLNPANVHGLAFLQSNADPKNAYKTAGAFSHWYYRFWIQGTLQFDLGAFIPGKWTHLTALASYKAQYVGVSGGNSQPWVWQGRQSTDEENVNGFQYYSSVTLAYQMPLALQLVGIQGEFWGNYSDNGYDSCYQNWNPTFMKISISPILSFKISNNQRLNLQARFASRRSFNSAFDPYTESVLSVIKNNPSIQQTGRQWYFDRIALSYSIRIL